RLYELNTVAYWVVEKEAHSQQLKAHLNKITQVAIDLSLRRGKTFLTVLKAEKRDLSILNKQTNYWAKGKAANSIWAIG
ncbi:MAG: XRE family transcriptional regulator, partial [Deltaproteobacteria bacterium]|nr:XRE family transcriptional regulator [Deltaproteobacteria bacterium]